MCSAALRITSYVVELERAAWASPSCSSVSLILQGAEALTTELISALVGKERCQRFYSFMVSSKRITWRGVAGVLGIAACCKACIRTSLRAHMFSDVMHCTECISPAVQTVEAISKEFQSQHARLFQQLRRLACQLLFWCHCLSCM